MSGKPKKLKKLTEADYWKIIQRFYNAQHKSGTKKSLDYKDQKYSTKSGEPRKETIMDVLNEQQKQFIARAYRATEQEGKSTNRQNLIENTARSLRINTRFLTSMSNIFSDSFLEPLQPEQIAEALPEAKREQKEPEKKVKSNLDNEAFKKFERILKKRLRPEEASTYERFLEDLPENLTPQQIINEHENFFYQYKYNKEGQRVTDTQLWSDISQEYLRDAPQPEPEPIPEPLVDIDIDSNIKDLKLWLDLNEGFEESKSYENILDRYRELKRFEQLSEDEKREEPNRQLYRRQIAKTTPKTKVKPTTKPEPEQSEVMKLLSKQLVEELDEEEDDEEISEGYKYNIFGELEKIPEPVIKTTLNRIKGESPVKYLSRLQKLMKLETQKEELNTMRVQDIFRAINKAKSSIRANQKRKRDLEEKKKILTLQQKKLDVATKKLSSLIEKTAQESEAREQKATEERKEISTAIKNINDIVSGDDRATEIKDTVLNTLRMNRDAEIDIKSDKVYRTLKPLKKSKLTKENINRLINEIPEKYRGTLAPTVRSLFSGNRLDANTIVSGVVGLGLAVATGSSTAGTIGSQAFNFLTTTLGFNFNDLFQPPSPTPTELKKRVRPSYIPELPQKEEKHSAMDFSQLPVSDISELPGDEVDEGIKNTNIMSDIVTMLTNFFARTYDVAVSQTLLRRTINYLARLPTTAIPLLYSLTKGKSRRDIDYALMTAGVALSADMESDRKFDDISLDVPIPEQKASPSVTGKRGIQIPRLVRPTIEDANQGVTAGAIGGALGGMLSGGASGGVSGIVPGGMAGAISGGVSASALRTYFNERGEQVSDSKIQMLAALPTAMLGAYLGYQGTGKEITSGAVGGITESKINVDADVLKSTKAQINQDIGKNKQWAPKTIAPTPAILDKPPQEMYAEDLEATLFDYVAPTSEGADGTVMTNQLKRNQYMNEQLRYYKSGVMVPHLLFGKILSQANMTPKELDTLALGEKPIIKIPDMEFIPQDNETTWDTVADKQYPNNEPFGIEFLDPYSSYSNTDNYWATNPQSKLYTINM